jgi:hypothetical protein
MLELKRIQREAIPNAIQRAEHYRLLNEPRVAESICRDVLMVDPENQRTRIILILAITDLFGAEDGKSPRDALDLIPDIQDEYARSYYTGIIHERQAKAELAHHRPDSRHHAYELLMQAMEWFEKAEKIHPPDNQDAVLRWNSCARLIAYHKLEARPRDDFQPYLE